MTPDELPAVELLPRWFDFENLFAWCELHATRVAGLRYGDRPRYFDRQGFPIPGLLGGENWENSATRRWAELHSDRDYQLVARDELPDGSSYLSTVWLGLDHSFTGPPRFFETMRFVTDVTEGHYEMGGRVSTFSFRAALEFEDPASGEMTEQLRYSSEEEALAAHHEIVRRLRVKEGH